MVQHRPVDRRMNHAEARGLVGRHGAAQQRQFEGPRFPDQTRVWDPALRAVLHGIDPALKEGVYAGLLGPSYETPAEVQMLKRLGADAVGMSTVPEAIALNAMGARLVGLSLVSNLAAGISDTPLSHDEVLAAGRAAQARLTKLLVAFCTARF